MSNCQKYDIYEAKVKPRKVANFEAVYEGALAHAGASKELEFDLVDGDQCGDELLDVLLRAALPPQGVEEVPQGRVPLHPGAHLRGDALLVLVVDAGPGETEAPGHLGVAVLGRQVQRLHPLAVGQVHVTTEGTEGLCQAEQALPGTDVDGCLPLPVGQVKVRPGVQQQEGNVAVAAPEGGR